MLQLPFVNEDDKSDIRTQLRLMNGWEWNLIVLFVLGLVVCVLVVMEFVKVRRPRRTIYATISKNSPEILAAGGEEMTWYY